MKRKMIDVAYRAYMSCVYFLAVVGAMYMFYNWRALVVEPFEKQVKVINIQAEAKILSPISKK